MYIEEKAIRADVYHLASKFSVLVLSAVLAGITTFTLILLMHNLVFQEFSPIVDESPVVIPDPIIAERPDTTEEHTEIERPEERDPPPLTEPVDRIVKKGTENYSLRVDNPVDTFKSKVDISSASYPVAQLLSAPSYPVRALQRGIEGWVDVRFDIDTFGKTKNIQVRAAEPQGYFEKAAIVAVQRWRFQALLDSHGEPLYFSGMTRRVVFEIEK